MARKIIVFAGYFYPHIGGYEQNVYEQARRLGLRGFQVDIVTSKMAGSPSFETVDNFRVFRLPFWDSLGGTFPIPKPTIHSFKVLHKLAREDYDIVITHTRFMVTSFLGLIFSKLIGSRLVHFEHGSSHSILANRPLELLGRAYDHTIGKLIILGASKNIGVSKASCEFLEHLGADNTAVVHNGINTRDFARTGVRDENRMRMNLEKTIVITYVGRLVFGKGVQDLLVAFKALRQEIPNVRLIIVGDGPYRAILESDCGDGVLFLGERERGEIAGILEATDIFVNPSYSEGLPTSVLEAAAMGVPVIATDVGGTKEIVDNRKTGLLYFPHNTKELGERLIELVSNQGMRQEMGANGQNLVRHSFDWGLFVDRFLLAIDGDLN